MSQDGMEYGTKKSNSLTDVCNSITKVVGGGGRGRCCQYPSQALLQREDYRHRRHTQCLLSNTCIEITYVTFQFYFEISVKLSSFEEILSQ